MHWSLIPILDNVGAPLCTMLNELNQGSVLEKTQKVVISEEEQPVAQAKSLENDMNAAAAPASTGSKIPKHSVTHDSYSIRLQICTANYVTLVSVTHTPCCDDVLRKRTDLCGENRLAIQTSVLPATSHRFYSRCCFSTEHMPFLVHAHC